MTFSRFNASEFEKFTGEARKGCFDNKTITNRSINKTFVPLKMICNYAAIKYGWTSYKPFFGFKKLTEESLVEKIFPFTIEEQHKIREALPEHWKSYFDFAFRVGLRPGEQIALKQEDIDWNNKILHVRRAITMDENGKRIEGDTKNMYSRRAIKLTEAMFEVLETQKAIYDSYNSEYFFCNPVGLRIHLSNLRKRVWIPALQKAGLKVRELKQTRHSFATNALSYGESPLWIAKVMGHRNTDMIIRFYARYVENTKGIEDGKIMSDAYKVIMRNVG